MFACLYHTNNIWCVYLLTFCITSLYLYMVIQDFKLITKDLVMFQTIKFKVNVNNYFPINKNRFRNFWLSIIKCVFCDHLHDNFRTICPFKKNRAYDYFCDIFDKFIKQHVQTDFKYNLFHFSDSMVLLWYASLYYFLQSIVKNVGKSKMEYFANFILFYFSQKVRFR